MNKNKCCNKLKYDINQILKKLPKKVFFINLIRKQNLVLSFS